MAQNDEKFFERADAHIRLSNDQLSESNRSEVSASMLFATSRFNAWLIAGGAKSGQEMSETRDDMIKYFTEQYRLMLEENINDYISNYDSYMQANNDKP